MVNAIHQVHVHSSTARFPMRASVSAAAGLAMSVSNTIRVGVIGAGGNTRAQHIPKLQEIPGVSIQVVSNRTEKSAQAVASQFGIPKVGTLRSIICIYLDRTGYILN